MIQSHNESALQSDVAFNKCTIEANASMFSMITSKLYNNTILAPIREWSTNAIDACLAANKPIKFDVTLPTIENCIFAVRDYGDGLSTEDINTLFSTLGASTKRSSNAYNGTFGIGRMAGLAYTQHSFTIESFYDGYHNSYLLTTKNGELGIVKLSSEPTSEPTGLLLSIPVKSEHIKNFHHEAKKLYRFFDDKPNLNIDLDISTPKYTTLATDYFLLEEYTYSNYVLMSNVLYTIPSSDLVEKKNLHGVVLRVPNGSITYAPNRESLILDERTVSYLNSQFAYVYDDIINTITMALNNCKTLKEYITLYYSYTNKMPYGIRNNITINWTMLGSSLFSINSKNKIICTIPNVEVYYWPNYYSGFKLTTLNNLELLVKSNIIIIDQKTRFRNAALKLRDNATIVFKVTDSTALATLKQQLTTQGFTYKITSDYATESPKVAKIKNIKDANTPYVCHYNHGFGTNTPINSDTIYLYVPITRYDCDIDNFINHYYTWQTYASNYDTFTYNNKVYKTSSCRVVGVQKKYQKAIKASDQCIPLLDTLAVVTKSMKLFTVPYRSLTKLQDCAILPSYAATRVKELKKFSNLTCKVEQDIANSILKVYPKIPYTVHKYSTTTAEIEKKYPLLKLNFGYNTQYLEHYMKLEYIYEQSQNCKISK